MGSGGSVCNGNNNLQIIKYIGRVNWNEQKHQQNPQAPNLFIESKFSGSITLLVFIHFRCLSQNILQRVQPMPIYMYIACILLPCIRYCGEIKELNWKKAPR